MYCILRSKCTTSTQLPLGCFVQMSGQASPGRSSKSLRTLRAKNPLPALALSEMVRGRAGVRMPGPVSPSNVDCLLGLLTSAAKALRTTGVSVSTAHGSERGRLASFDKAEEVPVRIELGEHVGHGEQGRLALCDWAREWPATLASKDRTRTGVVCLGHVDHHGELFFRLVRVDQVEAHQQVVGRVCCMSASHRAAAETHAQSPPPSSP